MQHYRGVFCGLTIVGLLVLLVGSFPAEAANTEQPVAPIVQLSTGGPNATTRIILLNRSETEAVTAGDDKVIRIWDLQSGQVIREIRGETRADIRGAITSMALSPDEQYLVTSVFLPHERNGSPRRGYLRVYDFKTGALIRILDGHSKIFPSLRFSGDGRYLIGGEGLNDTPLIVLWDTDTWQVVRQIKGHGATIRSVFITPDQDKIVSVSWDRTIRIWDFQSGIELSKIDNIHDGRVFGGSLPLASPQPIIVTSGADRKVKIWNYQTGELVRSITMERQVGALSTTRDGRRILVSSIGEHANAWIAVIESDSGEVLHYYPQHDRTPSVITLSRDGSEAYSAGGFNHQIDHWSVAENRQLKRISGSGQTMEAAGISADGRTVFWSHQPIDWSGKRYDFEQPVPLQMALSLNTVHGALGEPQRIDKSNADLHQVTSPRRARMRSGRYSLHRVRANDSPLFSRLQIKKGKRVSGEIVRGKTTGHIHKAYTFSADGKTVIAGAENGYLTEHRLDGTLLGSYVGHSGDITGLAVSGDNRLLVSSSRDQTLKLWNRQSRELLLSFFFDRRGEWIVWTAGGYYMSSPNGDRLVGWVVNRGAQNNPDYVTAEQVKAKLFRPDIIQTVIQYGSVAPALAELQSSGDMLGKIQQASIVPLDFSIESPSPNFKVDINAVEMAVKLKQGGGSDIQWSLVVNGKQTLVTGNDLAAQRAGGNDAVLKFPVGLAPGVNIISLTAKNNDTEKTEEIRVLFEPPNNVVQKQSESRKLLVISVGVNDYGNLAFSDLDYAASDADAIARVFREQLGGDFDEVETIVLSDSQPLKPNRSNILAAMASLKQLKENDTVVMFLAGHGVLQDKDYYFLPTEARLADNGRWDEQTVISWELIQKSMESSLGRRILLVDTCHSESAFNARLVKDAQDSNIIVMSSTDSSTLAQERKSLGHGVFTHAILAGLRGAADVIKDNLITMSELNAFVSNLVTRITNYAQVPTLSIPGGFKDFALARLRALGLD